MATFSVDRTPPPGGIIRRIEADELDVLLQLLDRGFSHKHDYFRRDWTHLYAVDAFDRSRFHVMELDGKIVGHVGLTPLEIHIGQSVVQAGGIGGVATDPDYRGKGVMSALLAHVLSEMKRLGIPISILGGDRQRYGRHGWEVAGEQLEVLFSPRYLTDVGAASVPVRLTSPEIAAAVIEEWYSRQHCWIRREKPINHLRRELYDCWIGDEGYACGRIDGRTVTITEIYSQSGDELGIVAGIMRSLPATEITVLLGVRDPRHTRLLAAARRWRTVPNYMFRINDNLAMLQALRAELAAQTVQRRPADVIVSIDDAEDREVLHLRTQAGQFLAEEASGPADYGFSLSEWTRTVFGGPVGEDARELQRELGGVLPIAVYVPELDRI